MDQLHQLRDSVRLQRFDVLLAATFVVMLGVTGAMIADSSLTFVILDRTLDVALSSLTTLAAAGLAALAMLRYRETARVSSLLQASAYATLAWLTGVDVGLVLLKLDGRVGLTLGLPEQLPLYVWALGWLVASGLLFAGGIASMRGARARPPHPRWFLVAPALAVFLAAAVLYPVRDRLPALIDQGGLIAIEQDPKAAFPVGSVSPLSLMLGVLTAVLLLAGALAYRQAYVRNGPASEGYLSIALVIAAFAALLHGFYPSVYTGLVTSEYFLRLLSYGVLLLGIYAEQRADLRALRLAYAALDRLRITETERAALEERSRLAREIHDGLAQHLWFAKLKFERLSTQLPEDDRPLAGEVGQALDSAIVEARQAMVTMRTSIDQDLPLAEMIRRVVDDFAQRSGLRVDYQVEPTVPSAILPRQQIELLRIIQEALTNVRKHADATVVRIRASATDGNLVIAIGDNGRGFEPGTAREQGLGIVGMEERARLMGGQLRVTAAPSDGTQVEVLIPLISAGSVGGVDPVVAAALAQTPPFGTPAIADPATGAPPAGKLPPPGAAAANAGSVGGRS